MGADIHLYAEKWNGSSWVLATGMKKNEWYHPEDEDDNEYVPIEIDVGRNYDLFSFLADVRNLGEIEPICEPRGLPSNICREIKEEYISWDSDAHSASWVTANELFNYDWEKIVQKEGIVDERVVELFNNNPLGFPSEHWPKEAMKGYARASIGGGCKVMWREKLGALCRWEMLKSEINKLGTVDNIRLVFWFDN